MLQQSAPEAAPKGLASRPRGDGKEAESSGALALLFATLFEPRCCSWGPLCCSWGAFCCLSTSRVAKPCSMELAKTACERLATWAHYSPEPAAAAGDDRSHSVHPPV